jgi:hypothetical protein
MNANFPPGGLVMPPMVQQQQLRPPMMYHASFGPPGTSFMAPPMGMPPGVPPMMPPYGGFPPTNQRPPLLPPPIVGGGGRPALLGAGPPIVPPVPVRQQPSNGADRNPSMTRHLPTHQQSNQLPHPFRLAETVSLLRRRQVLLQRQVPLHARRPGAQGPHYAAAEDARTGQPSRLQQTRP